MINELKSYPVTLGDFVRYLKDKKIDTTLFYKLDFNYRIGFYIEYLSNKHISIYFDSFNVGVFRDDPNRVGIIFESDNKLDLSLPIDNLKIGIIEAFKHLEKPF